MIGVNAGRDGGRHGAVSVVETTMTRFPLGDEDTPPRPRPRGEIAPLAMGMAGLALVALYILAMILMQPGR